MPTLHSLYIIAQDKTFAIGLHHATNTLGGLQMYAVMPNYGQNCMNYGQDLLNTLSGYRKSYTNFMVSVLLGAIKGIHCHHPDAMEGTYCTWSTPKNINKSRNLL